METIQHILIIAGFPPATIKKHQIIESGFLLEPRPKMDSVVALYHKVSNNQPKLSTNQLFNILNSYKITLENCGYTVTRSSQCLYILVK